MEVSKSIFKRQADFLEKKVLCQLGGSKNNSKHYEIRN